MAKEATSSSETENNDEVEQITIARALLHYQLKEKIAIRTTSSLPFPNKFPSQTPRPTSPQPQPVPTSKILPLICPKTVRRNKNSPVLGNDCSAEPRLQKFPAAWAAPYVPIRHIRAPCRSIAPPVTIRTTIPVFSAPPRPQPPPSTRMPAHQAMPLPVRISHIRLAPPACIRQAVPVLAAQKGDSTTISKVEFPAVAQNQQITPNEKETGVTNKSNSMEMELTPELVGQLKI